MAGPLSQRVTFRKISAKELQQTIVGPEPQYPVYRFGRHIKFEYPEVPGQTYRRYRNFP